MTSQADSPAATLRAKLALGDPSALVGMLETVELDFKTEPYQLQLPRQRQELAKDLSALANVRGGAVVLGFKTEKAAGTATDAVIEPRPFPADLVDEEQ